MLKKKDNLTVAQFFTKENEMEELDIEIVNEWQMNLPQRPPPAQKHLVAAASNDDFRRTIFHETTDLDAANEAANCAAANGFEHQIWYERQGFPTVGAAFLVAMDEVLRDIRGRREYLTRLLALKLPMPLVVISRDFLLDVPIVIRPGVMLTPRLDHNIFHAIRAGHINLPFDASDDSSTEEDAKREAA